MTEQNLNPNTNSIPAGQTTNEPVPQNQPAWKVLLTKTKPVLTSLFNKFLNSKFYQKKIIFWPVSIAFGLVLLVIILGLIFGKHNVKQSVIPTPSPTPIVQNTPEASESGNILTTSESELNKLKTEIDSLDINQNRLQPPVLDFEIKF